jgi:hypothetical protein
MSLCESESPVKEGSIGASLEIGKGRMPAVRQRSSRLGIILSILGTQKGSLFSGFCCPRGGNLIVLVMPLTLERGHAPFQPANQRAHL